MNYSSLLIPSLEGTDNRLGKPRLGMHCSKRKAPRYSNKTESLKTTRPKIFAACVFFLLSIISWLSVMDDLHLELLQISSNHDFVCDRLRLKDFQNSTAQLLVRFISVSSHVRLLTAFSNSFGTKCGARRRESYTSIGKFAGLNKG